MVKDLIVRKIINELMVRSARGVKKYGTTLEDNDLEIVEWLQHAKEEALDFALYLEKIITELKKTNNHNETEN